MPQQAWALKESPYLLLELRNLSRIFLNTRAKQPLLSFTYSRKLKDTKKLGECSMKSFCEKRPSCSSPKILPETAFKNCSCRLGTEALQTPPMGFCAWICRG